MLLLWFLAKFAYFGLGAREVSLESIPLLPSSRSTSSSSATNLPLLSSRAPLLSSSSSPELLPSSLHLFIPLSLSLFHSTYALTCTTVALRLNELRWRPRKDRLVVGDLCLDPDTPSRVRGACARSLSLLSPPTYACVWLRRVPVKCAESYIFGYSASRPPPIRPLFPSAPSIALPRGALPRAAGGCASRYSEITRVGRSYELIANTWWTQTPRVPPVQSVVRLSPRDLGSPVVDNPSLATWCATLERSRKQ